ncbi:MAG: hypothetical protein ACREDR_02545, partial [Blastocatellia bacterium]
AQTERHRKWVDAQQQTWWQERRAPSIGCATLSVRRDDSCARESPFSQVLIASLKDGGILTTEITLQCTRRSAFGAFKLPLRVCVPRSLSHEAGRIWSPHHSGSAKINSRRTDHS